MLNFVQNLQYYMMCEVLEPNWCQLEQGLHSVSNIDDVLLMHNDFLDKCLRDCMLSSREVLTTMSRLLAICISFTRHIQLAGMQGGKDEPVFEEGGAESQVTSLRSGRSRLLSPEFGSGHSVRDRVVDCERKFTADLVQLLEWLHSVNSEGVGSMVARLDFNGFYKTWYTASPHTSK
jgi:gamma-tubulin complex component 2